MKKGPQYQSEIKDTDGSRKSFPSATPRPPGRDDGYKTGMQYTGSNTYSGPDRPSEGRSDKASSRPLMSKKWIEK